MGKRPQKAAYVVFRGRNPGIYRTWPECDAQVTGFVGNKYQGYESRIEAERAWEEWRRKVVEKLQHVTSTREDVLQLPKSKDGFEMRTWNLPDLKRGNPYVDLTSSDDGEHPALKKLRTEVLIHYSPIQHTGLRYPPAQYPPVQHEAVPYPRTRVPHTQFPRPQYPPVQDTPMQNPPTQFAPVQKRVPQDLEFQHPKTQPPANFKAVAGFDPFEAEEEEQSKPEDVPVVLTAAQQAVVEMAMKRKNIFLTGAAGSGKTATLKEILRRFKEKFAKGDAKSKSKFPSVQVIAPTGIAALPLDGKTTYSFAGWNPDSFKKPMSLLLESVSKGQLHESINRLKVLIVEEISMVESQFLERLNLFMQHVVGNKRPFGGKQVIFLGDFHQLPPVKAFENCLHCGEPLTNTRIEPVCKYAECSNNGVSFKLGDKWAFKAPVWAQLKLKHVKLEQIHRQKDAGFQDILNKIRNGVSLSPVEWSALKTRKKPPNGAIPVRLMSLRNRVNQFNESQLASIKSEAKSWNAKDSSMKLSFSEFDKTYLGSQEVARKLEEYKRGLEHSRFPTKLTLKVGAKVLLLSNLNLEGGLVNGSQGEVVQFVNTNGWKKEEVKGRRAERLAARIDEFQKSQGFWCPVVRFANGRTRTIFPVAEESLRGPHNDRYQACRVQIPLALAWALTIHKSQGMTLNYVEVSSQDIFEPGQMYVGFSRATTIEGLTVTGDSMQQMKMDQDILEFYEKTKWEDLGSSNVARPRAPRKKTVKAVEEPALMRPSQSQEIRIDVEDQDVSVPLLQGPEFIEILDSE